MPSSPLPVVPRVPGFAVLDLETTGTHVERDRVVEVAVVCCDPDGEVVGEWTSLVHPEQTSVGPTHVHRISPADVEHAPTFAQLTGHLAHLLAGRVLVAHHAAFDVQLLRVEFARTGVLLPDSPQLCTLEESLTHLPLLRRRRLADCCGAVGVPLRQAHSALADARATAGLLRHYLTREAESGQDAGGALVRLVEQAAAVTWPALPVAPVVPVPRRSRRSSPAPVVAPTAAVVPGRLAASVAPAAPGRLAALVEALPARRDIEGSGVASSGGADVYRQLLAAAVTGPALTEDAVAQLQALAEGTGLTREDVLVVHRELLRQRAAAVAAAPGRRGEKAVADLAVLLGLDAAEGVEVLRRARAERLERVSRDLAPLPQDWSHGEPLRVGQRVAFTGCDEVQRGLLEKRTRDAGLAVAGAVSRTTALLVTDDPGSGTVKARAARQLGTRVVDPEAYAQLLDHVQPAAPVP